MSCCYARQTERMKGLKLKRILFHPWFARTAHSFKFAATLQADNDGTNPTLIRIDSKAGHGAGKPMAKVLEEQADIYGFIMYNLGMRPKF